MYHPEEIAKVLECLERIAKALETNNDLNARAIQLGEEAEAFRRDAERQRLASLAKNNELLESTAAAQDTFKRMLERAEDATTGQEFLASIPNKG